MEDVEDTTTVVMPSPAERLRRSFKAAQERRTIDLRMSGYDEFYITFTGLDLEEMRSIVSDSTARTRRLGRTEQQKQIARSVLARASVGSYVVIDGEEVQIGMPLGLSLYNYIWPADDASVARPTTDTEAISLLFLDDMKLTSMFSRYQMWASGVSLDESEELLGNS